MAGEQMAPQQGAQDGAGAMQKIIGQLQTQGEGLMQAAEAFGQAGAGGAAEKMAQAAQLIQAAVAEVSGGKQEPQAMGAQNPDVAGTNAQPVTPANR